MEDYRSNVDVHIGFQRSKNGDSDVEDLLRQIVEQLHLAQVPGDLRGNHAGMQEVLDVDLDGEHYTLVRSTVNIPEPQLTLSPREREIIRLVAKGLPNKAIASVLDISQWTVATHLRRVFAKLEVSSRAEMVARVLKDDLLAGSEWPQAEA